MKGLLTQRVLWVLCGVAMVTALAFALHTPDNAHPDEIFHADAFQYYEGRFWPPPLDSDGIIHSTYGWSYVYTEDIGYRVLGNLGGLLRLILPPVSTYALYRCVNVALLLVTLLYVATRRPKHLDNVLLCAFALGFPQFVYLYTYCNSDAFAISCSLFLFYHSLQLHETPYVAWRRRDVLLLGVGAGLLLTVKQNYFIAGIPPAALMLLKACQERAFLGDNPRWAIRGGVVLLLVALVVAGPLKLLYPLSQQDYLERRTEMLEARAAPELRPSTITPDVEKGTLKHGMRLSQRGYDVLDIIGFRMFQGKTYLEMLAQSSWGVFGWMTIYAPAGVYLAVLALLLIVAAPNARACLSSRAGGGAALRVLYAASVLTAASGVAAVLWFSLHIDLQAQGRYLYPAFAATLVLVCGGLRREVGLSGTMAQYASVLLFLLAQHTLWSGLERLV